MNYVIILKALLLKFILLIFFIGSKFKYRTWIIHQRAKINHRIMSIIFFIPIWLNIIRFEALYLWSHHIYHSLFYIWRIHKSSNFNLIKFKDFITTTFTSVNFRTFFKIFSSRIIISFVIYFSSNSLIIFHFLQDIYHHLVINNFLIAPSSAKRKIILFPSLQLIFLYINYLLLINLKENRLLL